MASWDINQGHIGFSAMERNSLHLGFGLAFYMSYYILHKHTILTFKKGLFNCVQSTPSAHETSNCTTLAKV